GLAMLPLLQREFVEKRNWLSNEDMVDTVAIMQAMPGIIAMNMGVLLGYRVAGFWGALSAIAGSLLPPFLAIVLLATLIMSLQGNPILTQAFLGVRAAVCALILLAVFKMGRQILKGAFEIVLTVVCFSALVFANVNAIWMIVLGILAGFTHYAVQTRKMKKQFSAGEGEQ
ncbi:MAG: chromate transporter, partial [Lentisphaeria bacterium]